MIKIKRAISGFLCSVAFLLFFVYLISGAQIYFSANVSNSAQDIKLSDVAENYFVSEVEKFIEPEINAESAISVKSNLEGANKIIFQKFSDKILPIASLTKLMSAIIILDNYDLSKIITINELSDLQAPMKQDVKLGDALPAESLLKIMLINSSNKSAFALAELMGEQKFVLLMNKKAKDFGMANTFFADPTGLSPKNVSTANDLVKLAEQIIKNYPKIAEISKELVVEVPGFGKIENTDQLLAEVPEVVCSKTGFTTEAKGCLLLVTNNSQGNDFIINVILGADDRFLEMKKLINSCN